MTLLFVPISVLILFSEQILVLLGQDPQVSSYAHQYNIVFLPAIYLLGLIDQQKKFLNSLQKNFVPSVISSIGAVMHIGWCYLFVDVEDYKIKGIGAACVITNFLVFLGHYIYTSTLIGDAEPQTLSLLDFGRLKIFFKIGLPTIGMHLAEEWAYKIASLIVGYIGVTEYAANTIVNFNMTEFLVVMSWGLQ